MKPLFPKSHSGTILVITLLLLAGTTSCHQSKSTGTEAIPVGIAEIKGKAPDLMGKLIRLDGMVAHVCRESGKRLFLGEENFKVLATNKVPTFRVEWEGSDVAVTGYLKEDRIDETYLDNWEKELKDGIQTALKEATHTYDAESKGLDENSIQTQLDQIKEYRNQIAEGGKGYISFYSLDAESIREK